MRRVLTFVQKERLYILLLIFIILLNVAAAMPVEKGHKSTRSQSHKVEVGKTDEDLFMKRAELEKKLADNKFLALIINLVSFLVFAIIVLGIFIDFMLVSFKMAKNKLDIYTYRPGPVNWNLVDVARVVILFLFFGYMTIIIESLLLRVLPVLKNDNFRMMLNSSILDVLTVVFIIYFVVNRNKERLISLGLSLRNFFKNVLYGMVGYVAAVPILIIVLVAILFIVNITKYVPERQAVVDLFLKEENAPFLVYTSIFAAVVGPIIEELFFRGFMYNAVKRYAGVVWASLITSAIFAALHTNVVGFLPIMVLGILLAYLYEKTGTLISSMTVHVIHNLSMVFFVFLLKQLG